MGLIIDEALQAIAERLENGLQPGDKVVAVMEADGLRVYSEFHEVCGITLKAAVKHGTKSKTEG